MSLPAAKPPSRIDVPLLELRRCSVDEHAEALRAARRLPFWWYQGTSRVLGNYSVPFQDGSGIWWYQVKPGLCWPVDFLRPLPPGSPGPALSRSFVGFQHVVPETSQADSSLVINAIFDLGSYGAARVGSTRRSAIRRGLRDCELTLLTAEDAGTFDECRLVWNDATVRTGWKRPQTQAQFAASWRQLIDLAGVSIIVGRDRRTGAVAGFLISKIVGDTAYLDTTASLTSMLQTNVSSALMYGFLANAAGIQGVDKAHSAIKSYVASLEEFKTSFGFVPHRFDARTRLRPGVGPALRLLVRDRYDRMMGNL